MVAFFRERSAVGELMASPMLSSRADAVARYIEVAGRLPSAEFPAASRSVDNLADLLDDIDAFVLDGFGVLNVGDTAIDGAVDRVRQLQGAGKRVVVLTNGATMPASVTLAKYARWGFEFASHDVVSSRDALAEALLTRQDVGRWGVAAPAQSQVHLLSGGALLLADEPSTYADADGFVLLSTADWTASRQLLLQQALAARPRPVLVGNPDLVAPRESDLSIEPGFHAHALQDAGLAEPRFYGKPFADVFDIATRQLEGIDPQRIAMVGDTLHTDVLGGAATGWRTVLVTDHGLMRGMDVEAIVRECGVRPDYIARTT